MKREDIIAMARDNDILFYASDYDLERFAALVIAKDRQRLAAPVFFPEPAKNDFVSGMLYTADQLQDYGDRRAAAERKSQNEDYDQLVELMKRILARGAQ